MIPRTLTLSGFLSYREPVTVDFTPITLACISGPNGAGKSTLLDAITWALFGQARQRGDGVINTAAEKATASVSFEFSYEENIYRVQRTRARGKSTTLEFQLRLPDGAWKPLTAGSVRETQTRIEETLRMDYDTFIHASFFLQGEADKFSRERPGKRKEVLGRILGLGVWETYREATAERRRAAEAEIDRLDGRMAEMRAEIAHEAAIAAQLREVEADIARLSEAAETQEALLREYARAQAALEQQRLLVGELEAQIGRLEASLTDLTARLAERETEHEKLQALLAREDAIRAAYQAWQRAREELSRWETQAEKFRALDEERQPLLRAIQAEEARHRETLAHLEQQARQAAEARQNLTAVEKDLAEAEAALSEIEKAIEAAKVAETRRDELTQRLSELAARRDRLKQEGNDFKARIARLESVTTPSCPLCGQPLTEAHKADILAQWQAQVDALRADYQAVNDEIKALRAEHAAAQSELARLPGLQKQARALAEHRGSLLNRRQALQETLEQWEKEGQTRLETLRRTLERGDFAREARTRLKALDDRLRELGYDPAAHAEARRAEEAARAAEAEWQALESARAVLQHLDRETADLRAQIQTLEAQLKPLRARHTEAYRQLQAAESQSPDTATAERKLADLRERIAELQKARGGLQQQAHLIAKYKHNLEELNARREAIARDVGRFKTLETAFGRNGIPSLLIEQALPLLEEEANRILERLTDGQMHVHFRTQAPYKDAKRKDMKETLDIIISDAYGQRDYESYSGGEAFRVDFAIRVALARLLAHRAGARLQTLVIDEGFGSQDAEGRQRLLEAIRAVQDDFAKILVITHIEELKEAFPARIEVRKTPRGSQVEVVLV